MKRRDRSRQVGYRRCSVGSSNEGRLAEGVRGAFGTAEPLGWGVRAAGVAHPVFGRRGAGFSPRSPTRASSSERPSTDQPSGSAARAPRLHTFTAPRHARRVAAGCRSRTLTGTRGSSPSIHSVVRAPPARSGSSPATLRPPSWPGWRPWTGNREYGTVNASSLTKHTLAPARADFSQTRGPSGLTPSTEGGANLETQLSSDAAFLEEYI